MEEVTEETINVFTPEQLKASGLRIVWMRGDTVWSEEHCGLVQAVVVRRLGKKYPARGFPDGVFHEGYRIHRKGTTPEILVGGGTSPIAVFIMRWRKDQKTAEEAANKAVEMIARPAA